MKTQKISDRELLLSYQKGEEKAFEQLVDKYKSRVYNIIYLIVKDSYIAEDLTQEAFMKVVRIIREKTYKEKERFHYWIQRVAYNLAIDYFRKQKRSPMMLSEEGLAMFDNTNFTVDNIEVQYVKRDAKRQLHQCMRTLPENQRKVIVMRHYMKMSFQDIAEEMGTSINTALGRMRYALMNLRKQLSKPQTQPQTYYKYHPMTTLKR